MTISSPALRRFPILIGVLVLLIQGAGTRPGLQAAGSASVPSGLVGWWAGDGNTDDVLGAHPGTLIGGAGFSTGKVDRAFNLNGNGQYVQIASSPDLDPTQAATLDAWVYFNQLPSAAGHIMAIAAKSGWSTDLDLQAHTDNRFHFYVAGGWNVTSTSVIQAGRWYHVAGTFDANAVRVYVNGVLETTTSGVTRSPNGNPLTIGASAVWGGRFFNGLIDEVHLFARALTGQEIYSIFSADSGGLIKALRITGPAAFPGGRMEQAYPQTTVGAIYGTPPYTFSVTSGSLPPGLTLWSDGVMFGTPTDSGLFTFTVHVNDSSVQSVERTYSISVLPVPIDGPGRILSNSGAAFGGIIALNSDGSNVINLTANTFDNADGTGWSLSTHPSVSRNGIVAFESNRDGTGMRIYAMNLDGTGLRQVTGSAGLQRGSNGDYPMDRYPEISPDGTRIAFLSNRHSSAIGQNFLDIYVVNLDGSNLHQVSVTDNRSYEYGNNRSVVWSPDGGQLAFRGIRLETVCNPNGCSTNWREMVGAINVEQMTESLLTITDDCGGGAALDWSSDGRVLYSYGGAVQGCNPYDPKFVILGYGEIAGAQLGHAENGPGTVRFSPDGQRILYYDIYSDRLAIINLDGSNKTPLPAPVAPRPPVWWMGGSEIATPWAFSLSPDPVNVTLGGPSVQVTPTLYDGNGQVIVHAATGWSIDGRYVTTSNTGALSVPDNHPEAHTLNLCASNAGFGACVTVNTNPAGGGTSGGGGSTTTPSGSNITVRPSSDATVTFANVSIAGATTVVAIDPASAGTLPGGYTSMNLAYDVSTTASYSPPVTVCFSVPTITDSATFERLRVLHREGGALVDRTILSPDAPAPNFAGRTICARTDSLSPFVLVLVQSPQLWNADYVFEYDGARTSGDQMLDVMHADWYDVWRFGILSDPNGTLAAPTITVTPNGGLGSLTPFTPLGTTLNSSNPPYIWVGPTLNPSSGLFTSLKSTVVPNPYTLGYTATRNLVGGRTVQGGATENRTLTVTLTPVDPALTDMGTTINFSGFQPGPVSVSNVGCTATDGQVQDVSSPGQPMIYWQVGGGLNAPPLPGKTAHTLTCALTVTNSSLSPSLYTPSLTISGGRIAPSIQSVANVATMVSDPSGDPSDPLGSARYDVTPSGSGATAQLTRHFVRTVHFDAVNGVVCSPISLPGSLPGGMAGTFYSDTLIASGGGGPYNFSVTSGGLPLGLGLSSSGTLSGNPTSGTYNFTIQATDVNGCFGSQGYTLTVQPPNNPPNFFQPSPQNGSTINATAGAPLTFTLGASDPNFGDTVMLTAAGLPSGASFPSPAPANPVQTTFSWTPGANQAGTYTVTFTATDSHAAQISTSVTINVVAAPSFTQAIGTPSGACICSPLLMNAEDLAGSSTSRQNWFLKADSSGVLNLTLVAHAVNLAEESGSMTFTLFDPSDQQINSVTVPMPTGSDPSINPENSATVTVNTSTSGAIYRLQVDLGPATVTTGAAHHYRFELHGVEQAAESSPGIRVQEGVAPDAPVRWGLNVAPGEPLTFDVLTGLTGPGSPDSSAQIQVVDPAGVVRFTDSGPAALPRTITIADAGNMPGQWRLDMVSTTQHYQLNKTSGADRGIYLTWLTSGSGQFTLSVTRNGTPTTTQGISLQFTNNTTGQVFSSAPFVFTDYSTTLPVGAYTVTASAPPGQTYSVSPSSLTVDLWCRKVAALVFDVPNRAPAVTISGRFNPNGQPFPGPFTMNENGGVLQLLANGTDADGDPLTYVWEKMSGTGTLITALGTMTGPSISYTNPDGPADAVVRVTATDSLGATATAMTTVRVNNVAPNVSFAPTPPNGDVINEGTSWIRSASFFDPGADTWTATVNYGDSSGTQSLAFSPGSQPGPTGTFALNHFYADNGTYPVTITVTDKDQGVGTVTLNVTVNNVTPTVFAPPSSSATAGFTFSPCVSFFDPGVNDSQWTATVNYGDGTGVQSVTINVGGSCGGGGSTTGTVNLSHVYSTATFPGTHTVTVTVTDKDGGTGQASVQVTVGKASSSTSLSSSGSPSDFGQSVTFTATVTGQPGVVAPTGSVTFNVDGAPSTIQNLVTGQASYITSSLAVGVHSITATYNGDVSFKESASSVVDQLIFAYPAGAAGGTFVIGDLNAAVGTRVEFWGAQWEKLNSLSGGSAPSSFKGFANSTSTNPPAEGGTWTADPGNSSGPPAGVASYIAVVVSSRITQFGSTITGNSPRIVVVRTDPGYDANPGHAGTGTVVAVIQP